jgi:hypothetical protein
VYGVDGGQRTLAVRNDRHRMIDTGQTLRKALRQRITGPTEDLLAERLHDVGEEAVRRIEIAGDTRVIHQPDELTSFTQDAIRHHDVVII